VTKETKVSKRTATLVIAGAVAVASLVGATRFGASTASGQVAPADSGVVLEWGTGAAPQYVPARSTAPTFAQLRGRGPLSELRWGNGGPPVLVRIDAG
jgi:hypothetical protein